MIRVDKCIVCNCVSHSEWDSDNYGLITVKCNNCDFIWINPRPDDEIIEEYYAKYDDARKQIDSVMTLNRSKQYIIDRDFVYPFFANRKDIVTLDFGCHNGLFLETFDRRFIKHGIEKNKGAAAEANRYHRGDVLACDLLDAPYRDEAFDLIMLRGVIEHLTNPDECMEKIYRLLKKDGILYLCATPNVGSFSAQIFRKYWNQYSSPGHLLYFSDYTLERYMKKYDLNFLAKCFPYIGTPYADVSKDSLHINNMVVLHKEGKVNSTVDVPYYNNMMNMVFYK